MNPICRDHRAVAAFAKRRVPSRAGSSALAALLLAVAAVGCRFTPLNDRDWSPEYSRVATAEFRGPEAIVHNVRNCNYRTDKDFDVRYEDRHYDLTKLDRVDYVLVPFADIPRVAHTFVTFGFHDEDYVAISIEVRRLRGQGYSPVVNFVNLNEIIYVVGDERDSIRMRSSFRKDDVYLYTLNLSPEQCQALFVDMLARANKLAEQPEFYNTLTNNCLTNVVAHLNHVQPTKIAYGYDVLFPGYSDQLIYNLGLVRSSGTFEQTREASHINHLADLNRDSPDFSRAIRR